MTLIATMLAIFAGSLAAGLAGFAFSAVTGALLFHWVPPIEAVPLLLACSITTQLFSISRLWRVMQWRGCCPYLFGGFIGIPIGAKLLEAFDARLFAMGFGCFLVCYSLYMLLSPRCVVSSDNNRYADVLAGFIGGISGGATAFPGAIPAIWCHVRGFTKLEQRGIVQPFILIMQFATLAYFSKLGILSSATLHRFLWCAPAVVLGTGLGLHLFGRTNDSRFRQVVLLFLLISGATLII